MLFRKNYVKKQCAALGGEMLTPTICVFGDILPGGRADRYPNCAFDPKQLKEGMKVEAEHTNIPALRREITKDHIIEHAKKGEDGILRSEYYPFLKTMEGCLEKGGRLKCEVD